MNPSYPWRLAAAALLLCACQPASNPAPPAPSSSAAAATPESPIPSANAQVPPADARAATAASPVDWTPAMFATQWKEVRQSPGALEQTAAAAAMADRWTGKQLRWTGAAVAGLCREADRTCPVNVFEKNTTPDARAVGGFFPQVQFDPVGWGALKRECAGQTECVVEFTGDITVAKLELDRPLALRFARARVHAARAPALGENWFDRPSPQRSFEQSKAPTRKPPTAKGAAPPAGLVRPRTF